MQITKSVLCTVTNSKTSEPFANHIIFLQKFQFTTIPNHFLSSGPLAAEQGGRRGGGGAPAAAAARAQLLVAQSGTPSTRWENVTPD